MRAAVIAARIGNKVIDLLAVTLAVLLILYGGYSLWDNWRTEHQAFAAADAVKYKPTPEHTESLEQLMKENPDVIGWLTIDGTHIDYPLVQGETNQSYINTDVHGEFALSGAIFLDSSNAPDFSDPYSLIYGHHMANGAMFGDVMRFLEKPYFDEHRSGSIILRDKTFAVDVFAVVRADAYDSTIYGNDAADCEVLLQAIHKNAEQQREIDADPTDHLIGLSTCESAVTNGRVVLYGRLREEK